MGDARALGGLVTRRFTLPPGCSCKSFVMRELTGDDELTAAQRADAKLVDDQKNSIPMVIATQRKESQRLSMVEVDGEKVNVGAVFEEMNNWSNRTMVFVNRAYDSINGVEEDELKKFLKEARDVDLSASTEDEPASDEPSDD